MKTVARLLILLLLPLTLAAQPWIPSDVQLALQRFEQGIRNGSPDQFEDLIQSGITMRLEDSLYKGISSIEAMNALRAYFAGKTDLELQFTPQGTGSLTYSRNDERKTVAVEVWISRYRAELGIWALNISNYPQATMFFDLKKK